MKKIILPFLFCCISLSSFSQYAKNFFPKEKIEHEKGIIALKLGASLFDGDLGKKQLIPEADPKFVIGIAGGYYFIPQLGVLAEYLFLPYGADLDDRKFTGKMNAVTCYLSLNVLNLISTRRANRWNLYINPGIGFTVYNASSTLNPFGLPNQDIDNEFSLAFPIEIALEYSFSNSWAMGLGAQYRIHSKDNFEAMREEQGKYNDGLYVLTLSVKHKISQKSGKSPYGNFCRR